VALPVTPDAIGEVHAMSKVKSLAGAALLVLGLAACENMSQTEKNLSVGTAVGAAGGLLVGAITGRPMTGLAAGAAAGAAGGFLFDQGRKSTQ
jgi:osmotically inducible lipoprotein OsmB